MDRRRRCGGNCDCLRIARGGGHKANGDNKLTCMQLVAEIQEATEFERKAQKEKGVTGTNVAAAVIFWPAIIGTYHNANEAIDAAKERKEYLVELSTKKGCSI